MSIFLQTPPSPNNKKLYTPEDFTQWYGKEQYLSEWNADIHMISTYVFLSDNERRVFAENPQQYLITDIQKTTFENISVNNRLELNSLGLVSSWMWFARNYDAYLRNEWSNYTNWSYDEVMPRPSFIPPEYNKNYYL